MTMNNEETIAYYRKIVKEHDKKIYILANKDINGCGFHPRAKDDMLYVARTEFKIINLTLVMISDNSITFKQFIEDIKKTSPHLFYGES